MKKVIKLSEVQPLVQKMKHLNSFCQYTKNYQSLEGRLGIMLVGNLENKAAEWVKKQGCYFKQIKGVTLICLKEENLPKNNVITEAEF